MSVGHLQTHGTIDEWLATNTSEQRQSRTLVFFCSTTVPSTSNRTVVLNIYNDGRIMDIIIIKKTFARWSLEKETVELIKKQDSKEIYT